MRNRLSRLSKLIEKWPLPPVEVAALVASVAEVLERAHSRGAVHGHLTPRMISVSPGVRPMQVFVGDWAHAPRHVDPRVDIRALGVVAYQALYGSFPVAGASLVFPGGVPDAARALVRWLLTSPTVPAAAEVHATALDVEAALALDEQVEELADDMFEILDDVSAPASSAHVA
jgi:serine/threonine protein kinase